MASVLLLQAPMLRMGPVLDVTSSYTHVQLRSASLDPSATPR